MRINRRRGNDRHLKTEELRLKTRCVKDCYKILPLLSEDSFIDIADPVIGNIPDNLPSPEDEVLSKDFFKILSDEARDLANIILSAPDEFFTSRGKIKNNGLYKLCKDKLGWGRPKTEAIKFELGLFLKNI
jgi:hypothetical protein